MMALTPQVIDGEVQQTIKKLKVKYGRLNGKDKVGKSPAEASTRGADDMSVG